MAVMSDPLVSVVLPTRDRQHLVVGAVRSVLGQTYDNLELFVVDDGSSVPVTLPADVGEDPRVTLIRIDHSVGAGIARDRAIARARGEFLAFCDDDDEWLPSKTSEQLAVLLADPDVVAVESGFEMRNGARVVFRYLPARRDAFLTLMTRPIMAPSAVMTRTAAVLDAGGFGSLERSHDWDLWLRMTEGRRVVALPIYHVLRRDHPPVPYRLHYEQQLTILEQRIVPLLRTLPIGDRDRILAHHLSVMGSYAAAGGQRRLARRLLIEAWRNHPSDPRPLARLMRTVIGERAWGIVVAFGRSVERAFKRIVGQDPHLVRF
jgi:glycosyltransferase involved in cell wall biosynthesis